MKFSLRLMSKPFDGFWDLKYEKRGSVLAASIFVVLLILTTILQRQYTGYVFNENDLTELNLITEIMGILLPFFMWCVANWALTTLFDGEGSFKDIYIYTAYALVPYIVISIPLVFVSRVAVQDEAILINAVQAIALLWSGFLIFTGTLTTHQYTAGKTFLMIVFIIIGMAIILFMGLLFFILLQQLINFIISIGTELSLRFA
jgi:hypothetical protein